MPETTETDISHSKDPNEVLIENGSDLTDLPGSGNLKIKLTRENFLRGFYKIKEFCEFFRFETEERFFCSNKNTPDSFIGKITWKAFNSRKDRELILSEIQKNINLLAPSLGKSTNAVHTMRQNIINRFGENSEAEKYFLRFIAKKYFLNPGFGKNQKKQTSIFAQKGNASFAGPGTHFSGNHLVHNR